MVLLGMNRNDEYYVFVTVALNTIISMKAVYDNCLFPSRSIFSSSRQYRRGIITRHDRPHKHGMFVLMENH